MVMITFEVDEKTAERLLEVAAREGITPQMVAPQAAKIEAVHWTEPEQPSEVVIAERKALVNKYNLDPDDPLLQLISMFDVDISDASVTIRETMDEFYRSHLDNPR